MTSAAIGGSRLMDFVRVTSVCRAHVRTGRARAECWMRSTIISAARLSLGPSHLSGDLSDRCDRWAEVASQRRKKLRHARRRDAPARALSRGTFFPLVSRGCPPPNNNNHPRTAQLVDAPLSSRLSARVICAPFSSQNGPPLAQPPCSPSTTDR